MLKTLSEGPPMKQHVQKTAQFGDLVAAVFDQATAFSTDPTEVSLMAAHAVENILRRARKFAIAEGQHTFGTR
jgi:hypothetical protein